MTLAPIRVVVVDDQPVFAEALGARLRTEPDLEVLAEVYTVRDALATVTRLSPDVVILDIVLGDDDGVELEARLLEICPDLKVVLLTGLDDPTRVVEAVHLGAHAWVSKSVPSEELVRVIRGVQAGEVHIPPMLLASVLGPLRSDGNAAGPVAGPLDALTLREREVLQCFVEGLNRAQIAQRLFVSPNTVRTHTQNLLAKLHVHSSLEAVAVARAAARSPGPRR